MGSWFVISLIVAGSLYLLGEYLRRRLGFSNETARKQVHVLHGLLVAIWPFIFDSYEVVIAVEILFFLVVLAAWELHLFRWFWRVGRKSWGEYLFPVGVIVAALTAESHWIYLAAILQLGLADATAALVGKKYGKHPYKIWGQNKSVQGSLAFFVVSLSILVGLTTFGQLDLGVSGVLALLLVSAGLTVVENLGVYGLDNLLLPVVTVAVLNLLA